MSRSSSRPPKATRPRGARGEAKAVAPTADSEQTRRQLEKAARDQKEQRYLLRLYVTGATPGSTAAIQRVRSICEEHLQGRYELEVFDIYQMPALAKDQQIIATPTLIKVLPVPLRRFIGDLSRAEKILFGLDLREKS